MRGISWFVEILRDRSKLLRLKLTNLFPNINFSGEKDSGKVLIIIIILFLIIIIIITIFCLGDLGQNSHTVNYLYVGAEVDSINCNMELMNFDSV